jgi:DNA-binding response OmpR family regulator
VRNSGDILIVEDDPLLLMNMSDLLSDHGFNPIPASSLAQARNALRFRRFDWIVCDHDLGDGYGLELVRQIRDEGIPIPVLYLSAALPEVLREAESMAPVVRKVFTKPVDVACLLAEIDAARSDDPGQNELYPRLIGQDERRMLLDESDTP